MGLLNVPTHNTQRILKEENCHGSEAFTLLSKWINDKSEKEMKNTKELDQTVF